MSNTTAALRQKIGSAQELQAVVRSMKAMAAASIGQYERAVLASADYYRTVHLGLSAYFRNYPGEILFQPRGTVSHNAIAIAFGSDQGLVGRFNEDIAAYTIDTLSRFSGTVEIWVVGERLHACLLDAGLSVAGAFAVPKSVQGISPLLGRILVETEKLSSIDSDSDLLLFANHPITATRYKPLSLAVLPLDEEWRRGLMQLPWPTNSPPEILGTASESLHILIREYLFVSMFRACAGSLASESASRLAAMQRADKNIDDLTARLRNDFHRLRQSGIDEELFDITAGYEALSDYGT